MKREVLDMILLIAKSSVFFYPMDFLSKQFLRKQIDDYNQFGRKGYCENPLIENFEHCGPLMDPACMNRSVRYEIVRTLIPLSLTEKVPTHQRDIF